MQLRSKFYTYPVITEETDFYIDSSFETDVEQIVDGYNIKLVLKAKMVNPELEELLAKGKVMFAHHIECNQTCYRKIVLTNLESKEFVLRDSEVNGVVQICSFAVANENIEKYSNSLFSQDYKGFRFNIERGCILAVGSQINLRINKIRDDLANTSSIFSIIPNMDETVADIKVDTAHNKIVISLPRQTFSVYSNMSTLMDIQPVMHSMIIMPALVSAILEIKELRNQLYTYEDYRWFRSLRKSCAKINVNFTEEVLANINAFELAQKLLDSPIPKAVNFLRGDSDED